MNAIKIEELLKQKYPELWKELVAQARGEEIKVLLTALLPFQPRISYTRLYADTSASPLEELRDLNPSTAAALAKYVTKNPEVEIQIILKI